MDAAGDSSTTAERLRELQRLRDDDLISDEEFEAQRARILDEAFGPGQTEMASGSSADGPDGSDADALSDEGATSSPPEDQPKPDPPGERVVNPARWPNWLRITAIVLSGIWIVTIPFMLWRAARYTWLPYFGVATAVVLILGIAAGIEGNEADQPAPAAAPRPAATAARTPAPRSTPTPPSYQTGRWVSGYVPTTVTEAMDDRDSCRDDATTGDDAWQAGIAVLIVQRGHTECLGWMRVRNFVRAHESTWIRHEYVANAAATPTPTSPPPPLSTPMPTATLGELTPDAFLRLWWNENSHRFPGITYSDAKELIQGTCSALANGASARDIFLLILANIPAEGQDATADLIGVGVEAFCPDQSYKFQQYNHAPPIDSKGQVVQQALADFPSHWGIDREMISFETLTDRRIGKTACGGTSYISIDSRLSDKLEVYRLLWHEAAHLALQCSPFVDGPLRRG